MVIELARKIRNDISDAEKILWEKISKRNLIGLRFRRHHSSRYIADFYCFEKSLWLSFMPTYIHDSQTDRNCALVINRDGGILLTANVKIYLREQIRKRNQLLLLHGLHAIKGSLSSSRGI
jgi:hypothetical protein